MPIEVIHPNSIQMQNLVDRPVVHEPLFREQAAKIAPVVTVQTITSTKAVLPGTPLASRNQMIIRNLDPVRTLRIGTESTVTAKVGRLIEPLEELTLLFDTATAISVWAVATGAELKVEVIES